jgi:hypothetical protein
MALDTIPTDIILGHANIYMRSLLHGVPAKMAMTPLERKARFKAAATLKEVTLSNAARDLGVSYNHLMLVLADRRVGSAALKGRIAAFLDVPTRDIFDPAASSV